MSAAKRPSGAHPWGVLRRPGGVDRRFDAVTPVESRRSDGEEVGRLSSTPNSRPETTHRHARRTPTAASSKPPDPSGSYHTPPVSRRPHALRRCPGVFTPSAGVPASSRPDVSGASVTPPSRSPVSRLQHPDSSIPTPASRLFDAPVFDAAEYVAVRSSRIILTKLTLLFLAGHRMRPAAPLDKHRFRRTPPTSTIPIYYECSKILPRNHQFSAVRAAERTLGRAHDGQPVTRVLWIRQPRSQRPRDNSFERAGRHTYKRTDAQASLTDALCYVSGRRSRRDARSEQRTLYTEICM